MTREAAAVGLHRFLGNTLLEGGDSKMTGWICRKGAVALPMNGGSSSCQILLSFFIPLSHLLAKGCQTRFMQQAKHHSQHPAEGST